MVYGFDGMVLAHGADKKRIGTNQINDKDADGKEFVKERIELAKMHDSFWQSYKFINPVTKKIEPKQMYCERLEQTVGLSVLTDCLANNHASADHPTSSCLLAATMTASSRETVHNRDPSFGAMSAHKNLGCDQQKRWKSTGKDGDGRESDGNELSVSL